MQKQPLELLATPDWLKNITLTTFGEWTCGMDNMTGVLEWWKHGSNITIFATPNWEDRGITPIEMSDGSDYKILGEVKQILFDSFEEYALAIKPFLDQY